MKKQVAIDMFGGVSKTAEALSVTRQAIHSWPDDLTQAQADRVIGAGLRMGLTTLKRAENLIAGRTYTGKPIKVKQPTDYVKDQ